jgi:homoserine kinase
VKIRVPATSANLGPGFDCLGLALSLHLEVSASPAERDTFVYRGQGQVDDSPDNLVHQGFRAVYAKLGCEPPAVSFQADNPIPLARGLGSSSAALVAGAALADALTGHALGRDGVFQLCANLEGHPDNVGPAVYGGFTVAALATDGEYVSQRFKVPESWQLLFAVPDFELLTSKARAILPQVVSRADAVFNASRTALWTLAVALDEPELLRTAAQDRIHEPYREVLVPGLAKCREELLETGAQAAYLSGAGPTLAAISCDTQATARCRELMRAFVGAQGQVLALRASEGFAYSVPTAEVS